MVEVTGVCDLCGLADRLKACKRCGRRVCGRCFSRGVCKNCEKLPGGGGELFIPDAAKPTTVKPGDYKK